MGSQELEVLGDVRLADVEGFFEVADAFHPLQKFLEYPDPGRVGDDLQQLEASFPGDHEQPLSFPVGMRIMMKHANIIIFL
jgi:hypothetical protein